MTVQGGVQFGSSPSHAGFGPTWDTRASVSYRAPGGIVLTAGVVGRRGYEVPLYIAEAPGTEGMTFIANSPILDTTSRPVLWDTVFRIEQDLLTLDRVRVSLVGDALNLVDLNRNQDKKPISGTLTSRVVRGALRIKF